MAIDGTPATGTATVLRTWLDGEATGTAEVYVETQAGAADGTATVTRALLTASLLRQRRGTAEVRIGGEAMTGLVGTVTVEESLESPVPTASLELLDERISRHDRATLTWGERPVEIDFTTGASALQTWTAFEGHVEASENDGADVPRGSIRATGKAAEWAGDKGCVRYGAFAGKRRGGLIKALADALGVTIVNAEIEEMGAEVVRPVEANGVTLIEYAQRLGEIEGWFVRVTPEGALELVTEAEAVSGPPMYEFEPSNYYAIHETVPSRPVTTWILSGSYVPSEFVTGGAIETKTETVWGVDDDGNPTKAVTSITTDRGVEIARWVEESRVVSADGVTPGPEMLQPVKKTSTQTMWSEALFGDGRFHYTTQMTQRATKVYELTGTPCDSAYGHEWDGGGRYVEEQAISGLLLQTSELLEYWTWHPADDALRHRRCTLAAYFAVENRFYSPRLPDSSGDQYPDGTWRADSWFTLQAVAQVRERWNDGRDQATPFVRSEKDVYRFVFTVGGALPDGEHLQLAEQIRETWEDDGSGAQHWHTIESAIPSSRLGEPPKFSLVTREHLDGPVPAPPTGSTATAQLQQKVAIDVFDASPGLPFTKVSQSEMVEGIEAAEELRPIGLRRLRTSLGGVLDIRHPIIPGLKLADPVTVTGAARRGGLYVRSLSAAAGYVLGIRRSQEILNGRGEQTTRVLVLPEWPT